MSEARPMEAGTPLDVILQRDRAIVLFGLVGIAIMSWAYLFYDAHAMSCLQMMRPQMGAWGVGEVTVMFAMWSVMMVAMMIPSVAPMVVMFAAVNRKRREQARPFVPTGLFLLGYVVVWIIVSALATAAQWNLQTTALLSPTMRITSPLIGAALLVAAGLFQLTPLKRACLVHCRNPLTFLMTEWREGSRGAFVMGVRHGAYCTGCCWFLMSLLFVAGVMNLWWVALISAVVLVEKVAPFGQRVSWFAGFLLIGWGTWVATTAAR